MEAVNCPEGVKRRRQDPHTSVVVPNAIPDICGAH